MVRRLCGRTNFMILEGIFDFSFQFSIFLRSIFKQNLSETWRVSLVLVSCFYVQCYIYLSVKKSRLREQNTLNFFRRFPGLNTCSAKMCKNIFLRVLYVEYLGELPPLFSKLTWYYDFFMLHLQRHDLRGYFWCLISGFFFRFWVESHF